MIKSLAYFPSQCAGNSRSVVQAFLTAVQQAGIRTQANGQDCDAALIWSVLWQGRMAANSQIYELYRAADKPVIIAEVGCLRRGHTWKVAINHITRQGIYGNDRNLDPDRPKKLNIDIKHSQNHHAVMIALQHRNSLQTQDIRDWNTWIHTQIDNLQKYTDRPVIIRPHPRDRFGLDIQKNNVVVQTPRALHGTYDDFDWSNNYHAVINHNSGPGILAALAGVRPIVDISSLAYPVSISMQDIEKPYDQNRSQWLIELCHTEYTVEEIRQGLWLRRLENWLN